MKSNWLNTLCNPSPTGRTVLVILAVSTVFRLLLASLVELGNDEVYYWTYALYPDWSHFDHPPMVGFLIQMFTFNLHADSEFFLRLGPITLAAINTWIMYSIGCKIKDESTGLIACLLYTASIYGSVISGFSIIPDAPQIFFWLLCISLMVDFLPVTNVTRTARYKIILFGCFAGLAMLSKYHSIFIWVGVVLYIVLYNRTWLKEYSLYVAMALSASLATPILIWNMQHEFISFLFHGDRVSTTFQIRFDYFFRELAGQMAYNNPVNYVLIAIALIALLKGKIFIAPVYKKMLLLNSLPLYLTFTGFSIFRSTLPHWTGPAFMALIFIAAAYWADRFEYRKRDICKRFALPSYFLAALLMAALYVINYSPFHVGRTADQQHYGEDDFTQDLYGWKYIGDEFQKIAKREEENKSMPVQADLIAYRWFPGTHEDYYIARPSNRQLFMIGTLPEIHKYYWINEARGNLKAGKDYYHVAVSNYYRDPETLFGNNFDRIEPIDTITVKRQDVVMRYAFVYRLKNYHP